MYANTCAFRINLIQISDHLNAVFLYDAENIRIIEQILLIWIEVLEV